MKKIIFPDFISLHVLTFVASGIPPGIVVPNHEDIKQEEGFKNISFANVIIGKHKLDEIQFLSEEDQELFKSYQVQSFEVQVGLHELLGHGSGKLFRKLADGSLNFNCKKVKDPFTSKLIKKYYKTFENYKSVFGILGPSMEECRAEGVGLYLSLDEEVLKIFEHEGSEADNIVYVNYLYSGWDVRKYCRVIYQYQKNG